MLYLSLLSFPNVTMTNIIHFCFVVLIVGLSHYNFENVNSFVGKTFSDILLLRFNPISHPKYNISILYHIQQEGPLKLFIIFDVAYGPYTFSNQIIRIILKFSIYTCRYVLQFSHNFLVIQIIWVGI